MDITLYNDRCVILNIQTGLSEMSVRDTTFREAIIFRVETHKT